jgi:hypothetical protein
VQFQTVNGIRPSDRREVIAGVSVYVGLGLPGDGTQSDNPKNQSNKGTDVVHINVARGLIFPILEPLATRAY